jgi:outer membrane lipoprotein-sorting protein
LNKPGCSIVSSAEPIQVGSLGKPAIVLEAQKTGGSRPTVVDRILIDPKQQLPLEWDMFENGSFQSKSKFNNFQTNIQLDDSKFKL